MNAAKITVGTHVHCILYGGRDGIVYGVHGASDPASIIDLGGVTTGGTARYDIVFADHLSKGVPEAIVRGVQWRVYDDEPLATAGEIVEAISAANAAKAEAEAKAKADADRRAAERVKHLADNPHLIPAASKPDWSPSRVAAENIRRELKLAHPTVKFAVKKDGYNCVLVKWTDGPTVAMVEAITAKYKAGSFNGMEDIYENDPDATFADVFGDPKYVSESRAETLGAVRYAWANAKANPDRPGHCGWGAADEVPEKWWDSPKSREFRVAWSVTDLTGVDLPVPATA